MTADARAEFDELLRQFCVARKLSQLDEAILDHTIDRWPMARLAKTYGTTRNALHRRKKALMSEIREFLEHRGIYCSSDVVDE